VLGDKIKPGDIIIGLSSTGIHSNGYTLARRVVKENGFSYKEAFPDNLYPGKTIGEIYLTPTQIYVKETVELLKKIDVHGVAHITGSGLRKLKRLSSDVKFIIEDPFEPQPVFRFIQKYGNIDDKEMYQTYNMGMGLAIIVSKNDVDKAIKILKKFSDSKVKIVGSIKEGKGVEVPSLGLKY
jgi:phosphoribosylformylglycinamidine cyclo-ligase